MLKNNTRNFFKDALWKRSHRDLNPRKKCISMEFLADDEIDIILLDEFDSNSIMKTTFCKLCDGAEIIINKKYCLVRLGYTKFGPRITCSSGRLKKEVTEIKTLLGDQKLRMSQSHQSQQPPAVEVRISTRNWHRSWK